MMLPKTACPDDVGVCSKIEQNRTPKPNTTSRFAIPPLLADPFPTFVSFLFPSPKGPVLNIACENATELSCTFGLVECYKGRLRRNSQRTSQAQPLKAPPRYPSAPSTCALHKNTQPAWATA